MGTGYFSKLKKMREVMYKRGTRNDPYSRTKPISEEQIMALKDEIMDDLNTPKE